MTNKTNPRISNITRVISMSVSGTDSNAEIFSVIRNAHLLPIFLPGWTLRVYVPHQRTRQTRNQQQVPLRIINKLKLLGVDVVQVGYEILNVAPSYLWKYLVVDDKTVDYFLIKDSRISYKDVILLHYWFNSKHISPSFCEAHLKDDHTDCGAKKFTRQILGGKNTLFREKLGSSVKNLLKQAYKESGLTEQEYFTERFLKPHGVYHQCFVFYYSVKSPDRKCLEGDDSLVILSHQLRDTKNTCNQFEEVQSV